MEIDTLAGLPAHPLFVHVPVIVVPMAALATVILALFPRHIERWVWWVACLAGAGALGAILTAGSGEALEERVDETELLERHADLGELARTVSIGLFIALVAVALAYRFISGSRMRTVIASVFMVAVAGGAVGAIAAAGHSGAESVWSEVVDASGETDSGDTDSGETDGGDADKREDDSRDGADRND